MTIVLRELRYAARRLLRRPGYAAIVVLSLAIGIAANAAIFGVVSGMLLRPLPYPDPDRLVSISELQVSGSCTGCRQSTSYARLRDWQRAARSFADIGAYQHADFTLTNGQTATLEDCVRASASLLHVMGATLALGRSFAPTDDQIGAPHTAILSYKLWQQQYGGNPGIIGRIVNLDDTPYTIIGVLSPTFVFPEPADLWVPLAPFAHDQPSGTIGTGVIARLRPGVTLDQANLELRAFAPASADSMDAGARRILSAIRLHEEMAKAPPATVSLLQWAAGFVLLLMCLNMIVLALARQLAQRSDVAVRTALGATRAHLAMPGLMEALLLSIAGAVSALLLTKWCSSLLLLALREQIPEWVDASVDGRVLAFALAVAMVICAMIGGVPAVLVSRAGPRNALQNGASGVTIGRTGSRLRSGFMVAQIASALILMVAAGLLLTNFLGALHQDSGYDMKHLLWGSIPLRDWRSALTADRATVQKRTLDGLEHLHSVVAASAEQRIVMSMPFGAAPRVAASGFQGLVPSDVAPHFGYAVSQHFFRVVGAPLLRGRDFQATDYIEGGESVVIVNEATARHIWPALNPIGQQIRFRSIDSIIPNVWYTVVGVAGNMRGMTPLAGSAKADQLLAYFPMRDKQIGRYPPLIEIRAAGDVRNSATAIRAASRATGLVVSVGQQSAEDVRVGMIVYREGFVTLAISAFAALALVLAALGIYGTTAYAVTQREREIGVRRALGATPVRIWRYFLRHVLGVALVGIGIGFLGMAFVAHLLRAVLYGSPLLSIPLYVGSFVAVMAIAVCAAYHPIRRAIRRDISMVLRSC